MNEFCLGEFIELDEVSEVVCLRDPDEETGLEDRLKELVGVYI